MAGEIGQADVVVKSALEEHGAIRDLEKNAHQYSFFQAVRLVQALFPDAARVGHQGPPEAEVLRFRPALDLNFATADLHSVGRMHSEEGAPPRYRVTTNFLGVYGPDSPLPAFYTEELMGQEEGITRAFLDLFGHRLLSLFYRVWEKYRAIAQYRADGADYFSSRLTTLLGLANTPPGSAIKPQRLIAAAGLLGLQPHSAAALEGALKDMFEGVEFDVEGMTGGRVNVPHDQRNRLGAANCALSRDLTLGSRVFSADGAFSMNVGPVGLEDFMAFLPSGTKMAELREITDLFNPDALDYEVVLWLRAEETPPLTLSGKSAYLGWSSWLGKGKAGEDTYVRFWIRGYRHG
ncbi:MAG: type VI secretion system baseplate subunit TssG [Planctomycetes bacterium]|nr:type VI secretion system baseplate subunit TssG [Planctomycetota bacterium]